MNENSHPEHTPDDRYRPTGPFGNASEEHRPPTQPPYGSQQYPYGTPPAQSYPEPPQVPPFGPKEPEERPRTGRGLIVGTALIAALVGGLAGAGVVAFNNAQGTPVSSNSGQPAISINRSDSVTPTTAAAAKAAPSVVTISVTQDSMGGSGSGVVIDDQGHIITNNHVVTLGGEAQNPAVQVKAADGKVYNAEIVGRDSLSDLAVLKVQEGVLPAIELAESGSLNVGDTAIAIGAPLGLDGTVTDGIISRLNRTISLQSAALPGEGSDPGQSGPNHFDFRIPGLENQRRNAGSIAVNVIQTDAAINPGNSGGALVDGEGRLIGINVAIASSGSGSGGTAGNIGVGFAIPIDYAKRIAEDIIEHGEATHGLLGVTVRAKTPANSQGVSQFSVGAEVMQVAGGSPADRAGIRQGDVITAVGDRVIDDALTLNAAMREYAAGTDAEISYIRNDREHTVTVTVADQAES